MKMMKKIFYIAIIFLIFIMPEAGALGVSPGRITLNYNDLNSNSSFSFKVLNTEEKTVNLVFSVEGELNNSIILSKNKIVLSPKKQEEINFFLNLSKSLKPGQNKASIIIRQYQDEEQDSFFALPAVLVEIIVNVPYPGKHVESDIKILGNKKNETIKFLIPVINKGQEDIELIKANINISFKGEQVAFIETNSYSLESMTRKDLSAEWLANVSMGVYSAAIDLIYDDETATYYKKFNVGEADLDIFDVFVDDFEPGNIVKLNVLVENRWSEDLKDVYANLILYNSFGRKAVDIKSPPYDIPALDSLRIPLFWNTTGVENGIYTGKIRIISKKNIRERGLYVDIRDTGIGLELESGGFVFEKKYNYFLTFITACLFLVLAGIIILLVNFPQKIKKFISYRYSARYSRMSKNL